MKIIFAFIFICFSIVIYSQKMNWGIENRVKVGFLAAHHKNMAHLANSHAFANELSFRIQSNGLKKWHFDYKQPIFGITLFNGTLGNRDIIGNYQGLYQFIEFPFIRKKHYIFTGKLGNGIAYGTKKYDPIENPFNNAIGSNFNALICVGLINRFDFDHHHFSLGLDISHCSNASSQTPNLGVNLPFLSLSYGYSLGSIDRNEDLLIAKDYFSSFKRWTFSLAGFISGKEIYPTGGKKYPVYAMSLISRYLFKPKVGIEISLDGFSKQSILGYKTDIPKNQFDILQAGVFFGYILPLDRVHFVLGMGAYFRDKFNPDDMFYHRVGLRYFTKKGIYFNVVLKSHWASADYFESGIGYTINYAK